MDAGSRPTPPPPRPGILVPAQRPANSPRRPRPVAVHLESRRRLGRDLSRAVMPGGHLDVAAAGSSFGVVVFQLRVRIEDLAVRDREAQLFRHPEARLIRRPISLLGPGFLGGLRDLAFEFRVDADPADEAARVRQCGRSRPARPDRWRCRERVPRA